MSDEARDREILEKRRQQVDKQVNQVYEVTEIQGEDRERGSYGNSDIEDALGLSQAAANETTTTAVAVTNPDPIYHVLETETESDIREQSSPVRRVPDSTQILVTGLQRRPVSGAYSRTSVKSPPSSAQPSQTMSTTTFDWEGNQLYSESQTSENSEVSEGEGDGSTDGFMYDSLGSIDGFFIDDELLYEPVEPLAQTEDSDSLSSWGEEWDQYSSDEEGDSSGVDSDVQSYYEKSSEASTSDTMGRNSRHKQTSQGRPVSRELRDPQGVLKLIDFSRLDVNNDKKEEPAEENTFVDIKVSRLSKKAKPALPQQPADLTPDQTKRRHIMQSIIDTELSYVSALQTLIEVYEEPLLKSNPPVLGRDKVKQIFSQIRPIHQCHSMFQIALAARAKDWDKSQKIGDLFVASFSKSMILSVYSAYVNNFTTAQDIIKRARASNVSFNNFLDECQASSTNRIDLNGLLLKPVQRFPQFLCLLQDMLKYTPASHPDRMQLQLALTRIETLASKLNERKKHTEQKHEVRVILKHMNFKFSTKAMTSVNRFLIRQDDFIQVAQFRIDEKTREEIPERERRLFMFNDLLICCNVLSRSPMSSLKYKMKWCVPLSEVDILELSEGSTNYEVQKSPSKTSIFNWPSSKKGAEVTAGVKKFYDEKEDLLHDLAIAGQVSALLSMLRGSYDVFNADSVRRWSTVLHNQIQKNSDKIKQSQTSQIQIALPSPSSSENTIIIFNTNSGNHSIKQEWMANLETGKLRLEPQNNPAWYVPEDDGKYDTSDLPLLKKTVPLSMTGSQKQLNSKMHCAVLCPVAYVQPSTQNIWAQGSLPRGGGCLWLCSADQRQAQMIVVSLNEGKSPCVMETFDLSNDSQVVCMEFVPEAQTAATPDTKGQQQPQSNPLALPTVWLATNSGRLLVYSTGRARDAIVDKKVTQSGIASLKYLNDKLFVGLTEGSVMIFNRLTDGDWKLGEPKMCLLGEAVVQYLLPVEDYMWCGCGNYIYIINSHTESRQKSFKVHHDNDKLCVNHMVKAGIGLWVSFSKHSTISLFHTETLQLLQEVNIASPVARMLSSLDEKVKGHYHSKQVSVTCMLGCPGSLWVGTSLGLMVCLPQPKLEGVPLVMGMATVAYHSHNAAIRLLVNIPGEAPLSPHRKAGPPERLQWEDPMEAEEGAYTLGGGEPLPLGGAAGRDTPSWRPPMPPPRQAEEAVYDRPYSYNLNPCLDSEGEESGGGQRNQGDYISMVGNGDGSQGNRTPPPSPVAGPSKDLTEQESRFSSDRMRSWPNRAAIVLTAGDGHSYLKSPSWSKEKKTKDSTLMVWQIP